MYATPKATFGHWTTREKLSESWQASELACTSLFCAFLVCYVLLLLFALFFLADVVSIKADVLVQDIYACIEHLRLFKLLHDSRHARASESPRISPRKTNCCSLGYVRSPVYVDTHSVARCL
jgi:hypothetical protein